MAGSQMSREELTELVRYHIVPSRVTGSQLQDDERLTTMSAEHVRLRLKQYHSVCISQNVVATLSQKYVQLLKRTLKLALLLAF